eukprot:1192249-Prorocentrum_minimum.AAC.1
MGSKHKRIGEELARTGSFMLGPRWVSGFSTGSERTAIESAAERRRRRQRHRAARSTPDSFRCRFCSALFWRIHLPRCIRFVAPLLRCSHFWTPSAPLLDPLGPTCGPPRPHLGTPSAPRADPLGPTCGPPRPHVRTSREPKIELTKCCVDVFVAYSQTSMVPVMITVVAMTMVVKMDAIKTFLSKAAAPTPQAADWVPTQHAQQAKPKTPLQKRK